MALYKKGIITVSIILPAYNRGYIISRAINSILNQTFDNWELLIIDDGSTDNTKEICCSFEKNDARIKYFARPHNGLSPALNAGIERSKGKFITFIGSDDEYLPEHLRLRVNYFKAHPEIDFIHGGVKIIGNQYIKDKNDRSKMIHLKDCKIGGTFFAKNFVYRQLGGFKNIDYSEDSEFYERAEKTFNIAEVNYPTYIYHRDLDDSISNNV